MPRGFSGTDEALGLRHKLKRVVYSVALARVLKRELRTLPAGERVVLHFHNQYNLYFFLKMGGGAYRDRALIAYTCHSYIWHGEWDEIERTVRKRFFQEVECMRKADLVFVLNGKTRESAVRHLGCNASRFVEVANGVDTRMYRPLPDADVAKLKREFGLEGKVCAIQVGSVCDRKNQLGALELLLPVMRADERVCFLYVGGVIDDEYKVAIDTLAEREGITDRVLYLGEVEPGAELNRYYNLGSCLLFPTKAEAFALVIIEAMAAGRPAFISESLFVDLPGTVRFGDAGDFTERFRATVLDSASLATASAEARQIIEQGYSWDKVAGDYASAWEGAFSGKETC